MQKNKILFIATSNNKVPGTADKTGLWLETLATPYYIFKEAGIDLTLASPEGGPVPLDPRSQSIIVATRNTKRFLLDSDARSFLSGSLSLDKVSAHQYDAVFVTGGHGGLWDLYDNSLSHQLMQDFLFQSKPIAAVAQGVISLLTLLNEHAVPWITDKQITSCSDSEENSSGMATIVPFLLENKLISLGATYSKGANYYSHVVTDGKIITGQNSASSEAVANKMLGLLRSGKQSSVIERRVLPNLASSL